MLFDQYGILQYEPKIMSELGIHNFNYTLVNQILTQERFNIMVDKLREAYFSEGGKEKIQQLIESDDHQDLINFYGFGGICSDKSRRSWWKWHKKMQKEARYTNNFLKYEYTMNKKKEWEQKEVRWRHYWLSCENVPWCGRSRVKRLQKEAKARRRRSLSESDLKHDEWDYFIQKITGKIVIPPIPIVEEKRIIPMMEKRNRKNQK